MEGSFSAIFPTGSGGLTPPFHGIGVLEAGGKAQACGWLIDRFGVRWQIVPAVFEEMMRDRDVTRTKRVTDAMLKMVKLDIATLDRAYRGN